MVLKPNNLTSKVFQCLLIDGENAGENALRRAEELTISDDQFEGFCTKHAHVPQFVPESNEKMRNSYLILDEYMRYLGYSLLIKYNTIQY